MTIVAAVATFVPRHRGRVSPPRTRTEGTSAAAVSGRDAAGMSARRRDIGARSAALRLRLSLYIERPRLRLRLRLRGAQPSGCDEDSLADELFRRRQAAEPRRAMLHQLFEADETALQPTTEHAEVVGDLLDDALRLVVHLDGDARAERGKRL